MAPTVLILFADGFEEIEATAPIDLLRRAEAKVTVASCSDSLSSPVVQTSPCGRRLLSDIPDPLDL